MHSAPMPYSDFIVTEPPAKEPLSVAELKLHCRISADYSGEYDLLQALIVAARQYAENFTGRALVSRKVRAFFNHFDGHGRGMRLPCPPLISLDSVKYLDLAGVEQTLPTAEYKLAAGADPAIVVAPYLHIYPITLPERNAVRMDLTCGYADIPQPILVAMKMLCGHWYENREAVVLDNRMADIVVPMAVDSLLGQYKVISIR